RNWSSLSLHDALPISQGDFEIIDPLHTVAKFDLTGEACTVQLADGIIDCLVEPCCQSRRLARSNQQFALEAEILADRKRALGFHLGSSRKIGSELTNIPVVSIRFRTHRDRAYRRTTRDHRRQAQIHIAGYGRNGQLLKNTACNRNPVCNWHV